MPSTTHVQLVRFEGNDSILQFSDGEEVRWPKKYLPDDVRIGNTFSLCASDLAHDPKELLNELLKEDE